MASMRIRARWSLIIAAAGSMSLTAAAFEKVSCHADEPSLGVKSLNITFSKSPDSDPDLPAQYYDIVKTTVFSVNQGIEDTHISRWTPSISCGMVGSATIECHDFGRAASASFDGPGWVVTLTSRIYPPNPDSRRYEFTADQCVIE